MSSLSIYIWRKSLLWTVLFLICFGLGYPSLNRYDPRATRGLSDTSKYYALVVGDVEGVRLSHGQFRVLVPLLSRPLYRLFKSHSGTWNPAFLALLIVNS